MAICINAVTLVSMAGEMGVVKNERFDVYIPNLESTNEYTASAFFYVQVVIQIMGC